MKKNNLYLVLSSEYNKNIDILEIASQAIDGGVDIIQMREKYMSDQARLELGFKLCELCRQNNVLFIVNDDPYLAKQVNADGVHLGQTDLEQYPISKVRQIIGQDKIIGISTHSLEQFKAGLNQCCDYLAYGPIFETKTKDYHIGINQIEEVLKIADLPVIFIGGINMDNLDIVLRKGGQNIALIRAIMQAENITQIVQQFKRKIKESICSLK